MACQTLINAKNDLWTNEKVISERYNVSVQTLRNWRHLSKGPAYAKVAGRAVRYNLADVESYFRQNRIDPEAK